jgi:hypothetical protein
MDTDVGTWGAVATAIITGGAEAAGTIMAGAIIVITRTFAFAPIARRGRSFW